MSEAKSVKQVLVAAKWMIQNIGWCKGDFFKFKDGKEVAYCLSGATGRVQTDPSLRQAANLLISQFIKEDPAFTGHIPSWNDAPYRTKEQVISLLNKAIKKAK